MSFAADLLEDLYPPEWTPPGDAWEPWLRDTIPTFCTHGFADHHCELWDWVWSIVPGVRPDPLVAVFARGGAKSTSAEMACVALGARRARRYGLYVCGTQEQANDHVGNVGSILESRALRDRYPKLGQRSLSEFGYSEGWKVNRLRAASGFTIDAVGLDKAIRGVKLEEQRPDFLVFDDIDDEQDSPDTVRKKIKRLTSAILPAGSTDVAVLAVQNLVHPDSVFSQLVDGRADFLRRRKIIGPIPAVRDLAYEQRDGRFVITAGSPTWEGQDLDACQAFVDEWGLTAFLHEAQHEVEPPPGGMYNHIDWQHIDRSELPKHLDRIVVWVDPAVTDKEESDACGIQCDGLAGDDTIYRLYSWEQRTSPQDAIKRAIRIAWEYGAEHVGVETDQGGDTWISVYREAYRDLVAEMLRDDPNTVVPPCPGYTWDKAGAGHGSKVHRSSLMLADYETTREGRIVHVRGTHLVLERALRRFGPKGTKPFDLADAAYWSWFDLRHPEAAEDHVEEYHDPVSISPI